MYMKEEEEDGRIVIKVPEKHLIEQIGRRKRAHAPSRRIFPSKC